jgi:hypothetical protein
VSIAEKVQRKIKLAEHPTVMKASEYPKSIGGCVDLALRMREARMAKEKEAELLKAEETSIKEHILKTFKKSEIAKASGKYGQASLSYPTRANAEDWEKIYSHIQKSGDFDLLFRRLNDKACADRMAAGESLPGVSLYQDVKVNLSKVGGK